MVHQSVLKQDFAVLFLLSPPVLPFFSRDDAELETEIARLTEQARNTLREGEKKLEEKFRAELSAKTRLANIYKSQSEEHNARVDRLGRVVTNLQTIQRDCS